MLLECGSVIKAPGCKLWQAAAAGLEENVSLRRFAFGALYTSVSVSVLTDILRAFTKTIWKNKYLRVLSLRMLNVVDLLQKTEMRGCIEYLEEAVRDGNISLKELSFGRSHLEIGSMNGWIPFPIQQSLCRNDVLYKEIYELWKHTCLISEKSEDALTRQVVGLLSNMAIFCYFLPVSFPRGSASHSRESA